MKSIKQAWSQWRGLIFVGLAILLLALGLRLYHLTILPIFADEAIYIRWSQVMFNEPTLRFLPLSDGKQPLFMWVLMYFVHRFPGPLFIGRLISVLTGMGTLVSVFALSYFLFKNKIVALLAAGLWAISPYALFYDRLALVDSMLTMFGICTLFWGVLAAKNKRLDWAMLTGFALGFASLTKSPAIFFALLLPLTWFVYNRFKKIYLLIPVYVIAFAMYSIQRLGPNFHLLTSRTADYVFPLSHLWINPKDPFIFHLRDVSSWLWILGPGLIFLNWLIGSVVNWKKYAKDIFVLNAWFLGPLLAQAMYAKVFTARYILYTIPPFFVLAASAFLTTKEKLKKVVIFIFLIFLVQSLFSDYWLLKDPKKAPLPRRVKSGFFEEWTAGQGIYEISEYIKAELQQEPETSIMIGTEGYFGTLPDALQMYLEGVPGQTVIGVGLVFDQVPSQLKESLQVGKKAYFVVNSDRLKLKPEDHNLELLAAYPKEPRMPGTNEYFSGGPQQTLYFFQVK